MGPTGSGKSYLAERVAEAWDAQLVNADAFQVYRGIDIGTNKPAERNKYELLDLKHPSEWFGVGEWVSLALEVLQRCWGTGRSVVVVGGTGLYIRALFEEYQDLFPAPDPDVRAHVTGLEAEGGLERLAHELITRSSDLAGRIDLANPARVRRALERLLGGGQPLEVKLPPFRKLKWAMTPALSQLEPLWPCRIADMLQMGWAAEVESLLSSGVHPSDPGMRAIGYQYIVELLCGRLTEDEVKRSVLRSTRSYAKRQLTWLRSEPVLSTFVPGVVEPDHLDLAFEHLMQFIRFEG